jgi:DNA helicase-4
MDASQYGFPSEITDDPLLSLVLAEPDNYPHSEERRLFYVAITRAKKQAHLIYDEKSPSVFITELINEKYDVHYLKKENEFIETCPECKSGEIVNNCNGFYACSNFPFCKYEAPACESCSEDHMIAPQPDRAERHYKCASNYCDNIGNSCPKCDIGMLVKKSGKYGDFWACHIWPRCSYTKNIKKT